MAEPDDLEFDELIDDAKSRGKLNTSHLVGRIKDKDSDPSPKQVNPAEFLEKMWKDWWVFLTSLPKNGGIFHMTRNWKHEQRVHAVVTLRDLRDRFDAVANELEEGVRDGKTS